MLTKIRMTHATAMVLQALSSGHGYGFDIMDTTGLPGGTVYPALRRLEAARLVESHWEEGTEAQLEGRPARKYYRLTDEGEAALQDARRRFPVLGWLIADASGGSGA
jgi:DNA-binding PadR family transcriptional regulator